MQSVSEEFEHDLMSKLKIQDEENHHEEVDEEEDENEEEEEEFSFVFMNPDGSPISADEAFDNGQIRPVFPVFNQDLLFADGDDFDAGPRSPIKKVFVQQPDNSPSSTAADSSESKLAAPTEGPYCEWKPKATAKSNSTGFSKLWRFKDPKLRSSSDGKDTFVFLNPPPAKAEKASSGEPRKVVVKKVKGKTTSSAHEKLYMMNRAKKESDKRKSYLPYKQELFGFFANANGLTRNLRPY